MVVERSACVFSYYICDSCAHDDVCGAGWCLMAYDKNKRTKAQNFLFYGKLRMPKTPRASAFKSVVDVMRRASMDRIDDQSLLDEINDDELMEKMKFDEFKDRIS